MSLRVIDPGPQATLQGAPRRGLRHLGVPASGPADALSMALANRLCGNANFVTAIEIPYGRFQAQFTAPARWAVTGAELEMTVNDETAAMHRTHTAQAGDRLTLGPAMRGFRAYLAVAGGFDADETFGSTSTLLAAGWGGRAGRALRADDELPIRAASSSPSSSASASSPASSPASSLASGAALETPEDLRPRWSGPAILRVEPSMEFSALSPQARQAIFEREWVVADQIDRMGARLEGPRLDLRASMASMKSAAVFPGVAQAPKDGAPILLGPDAQTTGGYPRAFCVVAVDLWRAGQLGPRARARFFMRTRAQARADAEGLARRYRNWLRSDDWLRASFAG